MEKKKIDKKAVSPVLATLLMIAVAVSMSVILFMWSQGFLATTSEAASSQQQAQNVAAQSSITIESVQFTDAKDDAGSTITNGDDKAVKIVVRNVGTSKITLAQVYMGTNAYQMAAYPVYKAMYTETTEALTGYAIIGEKATNGQIWYVSADAIKDGEEANDADDTSENTGYRGQLGQIAAQYKNVRGTNNHVTQEADTAIAYVFDKDKSANTEGKIEPQGFAVIHLYLSSAWSAGETYIIKVTTTVGTFAETTVTAPA
mgnify:CR=1 FL=1